MTRTCIHIECNNDIPDSWPMKWCEECNDKKRGHAYHLTAEEIIERAFHDYDQYSEDHAQDAMTALRKAGYTIVRTQESRP